MIAIESMEVDIVKAALDRGSSLLKLVVNSMVRIPASLIKEHSNQLEDKIVSDVLHFQRSSVDEFAFEGPKLGKVEAVWISLESVKYGSGDSGGMVLTPKEVVFGMLGFLACKVAVVLAAFKAMPMGLEENE
ncbi:hypothetical protein HYC85_030943 [Camellia sinensis]|uniref:DUF7755 domain-containing protein n=1 Tax=Camellia sinensis TaxID=4442 RepID=A0A7J7FPH5_CAMSI|nr:hypothetical protein HYC85_030943 [Camellia sinensis]